MTVGEFAKRTGLTRQRIYQLIGMGFISTTPVSIEINDISESELKRFLSIERPKGRPKTK